MSIKIIDRVWSAFPGAGSELLAMLALADWSDDNGRCFPAMSTIAKKVRLSKSQAQRIIHGLIGKGFLIVTANALGGSPTQTRHYRIVLEKLTGSIGATGRITAQEGAHVCVERDSADATQTVSEPSMNRQLTKPRADRQTTFPQDFKPNDTNRAIAAEYGLDIEKQLLKFTDHHLSKSSKFSDWHSALNTWLRKAAEFAVKKKAPPRQISTSSDFSGADYGQGVRGL